MSPDKRREKLAEKKNLEQRMQVRDRRFHPIESEDDDDLDDDFLYEGDSE
jgi:hypothetical protein